MANAHTLKLVKELSDHLKGIGAALARWLESEAAASQTAQTTTALSSPRNAPASSDARTATNR